MCGIVGYIGKRQALPILLEGIRNLEYRGYDSAGLAVLGPNGVSYERAVGRVANLERKISDENITGALGIVHSRWATHGGVTEINAHPHSDCTGNTYLVHNGILENYKELKQELFKKGHTFRSETDTEVLAHLIEDVYAKTPRGKTRFEDAVRHAVRATRGTYGLAIFMRSEPQKLIAVRNFSPLLVGIGRNEFFVCSDASAIMKHTRRVLYLEDGEMAVLSQKGYKVLDLQNHARRRAPEKLDWNIEKIQKGGYPHFMQKEIFEQPEAIVNSTRGRLSLKNGNAVLGGLASVKKELKSMKRLVITGCGTAFLAGRVGEYMLEEYARLPVEVELASEFRYRKAVLQKGDVLLAISQSGETADTLAAVNEARERGILTLGIVNAVGSTIARETDAGVYQHIGPEIAVASTKAFTSQVAILGLITLLVGRERGLDHKSAQNLAHEIKRLPGLIERVLGQDEHIRSVARAFLKYKNFLYLGRKYNFPTAMEGALKLKEISYVHAEGMSSGEMKHGSIAMIDRGFPSVFIIPKDSVYAKNISNLEEVRARGGPVVAVATEGDKDTERLAKHAIFIPHVAEPFTPILAAVALQLFAYHFAVLRGRDVDKPRNLAKSVTVE